MVASGYGVAFGARVVLADLHFEIASHGITVLMGPVGTGKSTLLRSIVGLNNPVSISGNGAAWNTPDSWSSGPLPGTRPAARAIAEQVGLREPDRSHSPPVATGRHGTSTARHEDAGGPEVPELLSMLERPSIDVPVVLQRIVSIVSGVLAKPAS